MKEIQLTQGKVALVSDHRFDELNRWKWSASFYNGKWYAVRFEGPRLLQKTIRMHRQIMNVADPKIEVDHWDGDGLNNQDENLRVCTHIENSHNTSSHKDSIVGFKGVTWNKKAKKYQVQIMVDGKAIYLGLFTDSTEAARAYDNAAKEFHGPFAKLNF